MAQRSITSNSALNPISCTNHSSFSIWDQNVTCNIQEQLNAPMKTLLSNILKASTANFSWSSSDWTGDLDVLYLDVYLYPVFKLQCENQIQKVERILRHLFRSTLHFFLVYREYFQLGSILSTCNQKRCLLIYCLDHHCLNKCKS